MANTLDEVKRNLCAVGQFDLASALGSNSSAVEGSKVLRYTRYLIALNGFRSHYAAKTRASIIAALWGYVESYSNDEYLRATILICIERLVRECHDINSIHGQLEALSAAYAASFDQLSDLRKLVRLVNLEDFDELRRLLPKPDTNAMVNVFGRAYQYYKYGNMDRLAYNEALKEVEL